MPVINWTSIGLPQSSEVVRLVVDANETAADAADTACQTDRLLAPLLNLDQDIDAAVLRPLDDFVVLLLDLVEEAQLIQAQDGHLQEVAVKQVGLLQDELPAQNLVTRLGVAGEIDPVNDVLLSLGHAKY